MKVTWVEKINLPQAKILPPPRPKSYPSQKAFTPSHTHTAETPCPSMVVVQTCVKQKLILWGYSGQGIKKRAEWPWK